MNPPSEIDIVELVDTHHSDAISASLRTLAARGGVLYAPQTGHPSKYIISLLLDYVTHLYILVIKYNLWG
jgi:hypothetical protein